MAFEELIPAGAEAARQEIPRPQDVNDRDFLIHESEVRIQRSEVDVAEGRITKQQQIEFASKLRTEVRELTGTAVQR